MGIVTARPQSPALARFIESFDYIESDLPFSVERILPGGRVHVMVNLHENEFRTYDGPGCRTVHRTRGAIFGGAYSRATAIDTKEQRCLVAVNFRLGGAWPFLKMPVSEAQGQLVELENVWGCAGATLRERMLEAETAEEKFRVFERVLTAQMVRQEEPDPAIAFAAHAFERGIRVRKVVARLGMLPKTFARRFENRVGLKPKEYSRVQRLQRVLRCIAQAREVDWPDFAAEHGFADQAHLIHDFREMTGLTPTAYQPRAPGEHNHVPVTSAE